MSAADELRDLLKENGERIRKTSKSHELWRLKNGATVTVSSHIHRAHASAALNELTRLKRMLRTIPPAIPTPQLKLLVAEPEAIAPSPPPVANEESEVKTKRTRLSWTPEQDQLLLESAEAGFAYEEIVGLLVDTRPGITVGAVGNRLTLLRKEQPGIVVEPPQENEEMSTPNPPVALAVTSMIPKAAPIEEDEAHKLVRDLTLALAVCLRNLEGDDTLSITKQGLSNLVDRGLRFR